MNHRFLTHVPVLQTLSEMAQRSTPAEPPSTLNFSVHPTAQILKQTPTPAGFVLFGEINITNVGDSFNGSKVTGIVRDLQQSLNPTPVEASERTMRSLLEEIRSSAYSREWDHLCVRSGRMVLPEGSQEAFQVLWRMADGFVNTATWFKKP